MVFNKVSFSYCKIQTLFINIHRRFNWVRPETSSLHTVKISNLDFWRGFGYVSFAVSEGKKKYSYSDLHLQD